MYIAENPDAYYFFNIGKRIIIDTDNLDPSFVQYVIVDVRMPLTSMSYTLFGSQHLWWIIAVMNKLNPIEIPPAGTVIVVPKRQYISDVLQLIKNSLK